MGSDEREIREVHSTWISAVNTGDLVRLLTLMAEDLVSLNPGQAPSGRDGFSANFSAAHQRFGSVAAASWKRSSSPAKSHTRGAGTRCQ
jgi:ketosteroid isomerase-like protein